MVRRIRQQLPYLVLTGLLATALVITGARIQAPADGSAGVPSTSLGRLLQVAAKNGPVACPADEKNDTSDGIPASTKTVKYPGEKRCIDGYRLSTRGRLAPSCLLADTSRTKTYRPAECSSSSQGKQAEAIAQARAIAQFNTSAVEGHTSKGGITPDVQWEVVWNAVTPRSKGLMVTNRADIAVYDHTAKPADAEVGLLEVKGDWNGDLKDVNKQLADYVASWPSGRAVPYRFPAGAQYEDDFEISDPSDRCSDNSVRIRPYKVRSEAANPGVLFVKEGASCGAASVPPPVTTPDDDDPTFTIPIGQDNDHNGQDDFIDYVRAHPELWSIPPGFPSLPKLSGGARTIIVTVASVAALLLILAAAPELAPVLGEIMTNPLTGPLLQYLPAVIAALLKILGWLISGDPHLRTFDGRAYDVQSVGEFHLLEAPGVDLDLQGRLTPIGGRVSAIDRIAFDVGDGTVEVGRDGVLLLNGIPTDIAELGVLDLGDGAAVFKSGSRLVFTLPGSSDRTVIIWSATGALSIRPPSSASVSGLLGNNDGKPSNDLALRDGTVLPAGSPTTAIHGPFADSWRISDDESLFSYPAGKGTDAYTDRSYPTAIPKITDFSAAEIDAATNVCSAKGVDPGTQFDNCLLDLLLTGDAGYAEVAADTVLPSVDPAAKGLDASGQLKENFEAAVPVNLDSHRYRTDAGTSRVAGPIFSAGGYRFTVPMPRHGGVTLDADLVAFGPVESDAVVQSVDVAVAGSTTVHAELQGDTPAVTPEPDTSLSFVRSGTTTGGEPFRIYHLSTKVPHWESQLAVTLNPKNFSGTLSTSLGFDNLAVTAQVPAVDQFTLPALPVDIAADTPAPGLGRLAAAGDAQALTFDLPTSDANLLIRVKSGCTAIALTLRESATGKLIAPRNDVCEVRRYDQLPAGRYTLEVGNQTGAEAGYGLSLISVPDVTAALAVDGPALTLATQEAGQNAAASFTGVAGRRIQLQVSGSTYPAAPAWQVVRPDGAVLSSGQGNGLMDTTTLASGGYSVRVDPTGVGTGSVVIKAWSVPDDVDAGTLTVGGEATAMTTTASGQSSVGHFAGTSGQLLLLKTSDSDFPSGSQPDVGITTPGGARLVSLRGEDTSRRVKLPETGTYTVTMNPAGVTSGTVKARLVPAPLPTMVTLRSTTADDGSAVLTATTDGPVSDSDSIWVGIYDTGTKARIGYCSSGTECTLRGVVPQGGGAHNYIAAVGAIPATWTGVSGQWFTSNLVGIEPWAVGVGSAVASDGTLTVTATTNYPVNGTDAIWIGIYDATTSERIGYCSSGRTCRLSGIVPRGGTAHSFVATAGAITGAWSPGAAGNWAVSEPAAVAAWSVTLTNTVAADGTLALTATTNYPVNSANSIWTAIYDQTTAERLGYCSSGRTCVISGVSPKGPSGTHSFVASAGIIPGSWKETADNWAVSNLVKPDAWSVSLSSETASDGSLTLTSVTNYPVDSSKSIWAAIYDTVTTERIGSCSSGTTCVLTSVVPRGGGVHPYVALVGTIPGSWNPATTLTRSNEVIPPGWAVSLTSATADDGTLTFDATSNYPVASARSIWIAVYDKTTGERLGYCSSGTTCRLTGIVPIGGGVHDFVATTGVIPSTWTPNSASNWAISSPVSVAPWLATLAVSRADDGSLTAAAATNYPVNSSRSIWLAIYDRTTGARLGYCSSGRTCKLTGIVPIGGGTHSLVASAGVIPATWTTTSANWGISNDVPLDPWVVDLAATDAADGSLTLTATSNYPINSAKSIWIGIYDQTTGARLGYCSTGIKCTLTGIVPIGGGIHNYVATAGVIPSSWATSTGNWDASDVISGSPWRVTLVVTKATDGTLTLTADTNYPVNSAKSIWTGIYDQTSGTRLGYCSSGITCTLSRIAAGTGARTFIASVGVIPGTWGNVAGNWAVTDPVSYPT